MMSKGKRLSKWGLLIAFFTMFLTACENQKIGVLNPQGPVAQKQFDLIIWSSILMLFVLVVTSALFVYMIVKYRSRPGDEDYEPPEHEGNKWLEVIWTAVPVIIVIALAIPTVTTTFDLEKSPSPHKKPMTIEVISADWKWIFRYPEQGISTVNYLQIPADTPIQFKLNAMGPMNSFWIPELGGQEYTMPDMEMRLWLEADKPGVYKGKSSSFSGEGFSHMKFDVIASSQKDFDAWVAGVKKSAPAQTKEDFEKLVKPGIVSKLTYSSYPDVVLPKDKNKNHMNHNMNHNMDMNSQNEHSNHGDQEHHH